MKKLTIEQFIRYRNKTQCMKDGPLKIKITSIKSTITPNGETLQTRETVETFIAENGKTYKMHIITKEGQPGVWVESKMEYILEAI